MGSATEASVKDIADWHEETVDRYAISDAGEQRVQRHHVLDKTTTATGQVQVDNADWTAQYAADGTIAEKRGFQSVHSHTIQEPANGSYETSDELGQWTGPVRYTIYDRTSSSTTFVNGNREHVETNQLHQDLTFANFTDMLPIQENTTTYRHVTNWWPGGSPLLSDGWERTNISVNKPNPAETVSTRDYMFHERNYSDSPGSTLVLDRREARNTKKVTDNTTGAFVETLRFSLDRSTEYSSAGVPEFFSFSLIDNWVPPGRAIDLDLGWNSDGWVDEVTINNGVPGPAPTTQGGWNALSHSYRQCYDEELSAFGNVPPDAYPPLAPSFPPV